MRQLLKIVFIFMLLCGCAASVSSCGGGGSSDGGGDDGGGGGGGGGDGGGGDTVTPLAIDTTKAVTITTNAPTVYALRALGFDLELGDLGLASMSVGKAIPLSSLTCATGMTETVACEAGGDVSIAMDCHSVETDHCGIVADGTMTYNNCSPVGGVVLSGSMNVSPFIATALGCDFDTSELVMKLTSDDFTVAGDVSIVVDALAYAVDVISGTIDVTVDSAVLQTDEGVVNCAGNTAGGFTCDPSIELQEVSYCHFERDICEVGEAGDAYCADVLIPSTVCDDGCCETYAVDVEFTCIRERECPQLFSNNFSVMFSAVQGVGEDAVPYEVPFTCVNSVWQVPCLTDVDCRLGARCNLESPELGSIEFSDFLPLFKGYGFCECVIYASSDGGEPSCGEGPDKGDPDACCSDGIDNDDNGQIDCDDDMCIGVAPICISSLFESICDDGIDNDDDGKVDCDDIDCFGASPGCETELNCSDGEDNDNDASSDCCDDDCASDPFCDGFVVVGSEAGLCDDDWDNDCDGRIDCRDVDCLGNDVCDAFCDMVCLGGQCSLSGCSEGEQCDCDSGLMCMTASACLCCVRERP